MTRDQLREAIEGPVSVSGGQVTPRLVQRLLHDVDRLAKGHGRNRTVAREPDPLPLLQHALMRVWEVSRDARERDEPMDLVHYEHPTVDTLWNALDLHAEEAYGALPDDTAKSIARRAFQRLTERDPAGRENPARQPAPRTHGCRARPRCFANRTRNRPRAQRPSPIFRPRAAPSSSSTSKTPSTSRTRA